MTRYLDTDPGPKSGKKTITLKTIEDSVLEARKTWLDNMVDPDHLADEVTRVLDHEFKTMILKFLGFENRWFGEWEVDHTNGRAGESFVGQEVRSQAAKAAEAIVAEALGQKIELTAQQKRAIIKDFREEVERNARRILLERANSVATEIVDSVLAEDEVFVRRFRDGRLKDAYS